MNPDRIPIEQLEKLMLEKSFSALSEQEKELALSFLTSQAEYDDLRNTLLQIRSVFAEDKKNLKMPEAGKEALLEKFRNQRNLKYRAPVIKTFKPQWMWVAAASLLLIISLILVNQQYDVLKNNREIALQSDLPQHPSSDDKKNMSELSENKAFEESIHQAQENEKSNSGNINHSLNIPDKVNETRLAYTEENAHKLNSQQLPVANSAIETKNLAPPVAVADETMVMEYTDSESLQTVTKRDHESKQEKHTKDVSNSLFYNSEKKQGISEERKAAIRKSFLFTDI
ncbi:MAG: hypothetical protein N2167_06385 [Flavobacteriales bacterium]|nr:hypothetical protein [Flavobacteriales bacterium]